MALLGGVRDSDVPVLRRAAPGGAVRAHTAGRGRLLHAGERRAHGVRRRRRVGRPHVPGEAGAITTSMGESRMRTMGRMSTGTLCVNSLTLQGAFLLGRAHVLHRGEPGRQHCPRGGTHRRRSERARRSGPRSSAVCRLAPIIRPIYHLSINVPPYPCQYGHFINHDTTQYGCFTARYHPCQYHTVVSPDTIPLMIAGN